MNEILKAFSFGAGAGLFITLAFFITGLFKSKRHGADSELGNAIEEAGNLVQSASGTATELGSSIEESIGVCHELGESIQQSSGVCQDAQQSNSELADSIATSWRILQELKKRKNKG